MPNFEQFNEYYQAHMPQVYGYVYMRTGRNKELAEDIVSEIFLKAVENFDQFDNKKGAFKSWIFQITKNYLIDHFRAQKNRETTSLDELENVIKSANNTSKSAQGEIEKEIIKEAIDSLPSAKKELIILRYFSGYAYEEIAEVTKENANKIRVTVHRTLQELSRKLNKLKYQSSE